MSVISWISRRLPKKKEVLPDTLTVDILQNLYQRTPAEVCAVIGIEYSGQESGSASLRYLWGYLGNCTFTFEAGRVRQILWASMFDLGVDMSKIIDIAASLEGRYGKPAVIDQAENDPTWFWHIGDTEYMLAITHKGKYKVDYFTFGITRA